MTLVVRYVIYIRAYVEYPDTYWIFDISFEFFLKKLKKTSEKRKFAKKPSPDALAKLAPTMQLTPHVCNDTQGQHAPPYAPQQKPLRTQKICRFLSMISNT